MGTGAARSSKALAARADATLRRGSGATPRARARRASRDPCARRTPGDARGRTVPTPRRTCAPRNSSRGLRGRGEKLTNLLGPDDVAGQPVGALRPVVAEILDAGLQRNDVPSGGPRHREIGRRDLEYLADPVGVALAERILEDDLVTYGQVGEAVEDVV